MKSSFLLFLLFALSLTQAGAQSRRRASRSPTRPASGAAKPAAAPTGPERRATYCNPLNLDYGYTPILEYTTAGRHRATADPVITLYRDDYYLFSTNQEGYWWSHDLARWTFVARSFLKPEQQAAARAADAPAADAQTASVAPALQGSKPEAKPPAPIRYDDLCAPAVFALGDTLLVLGSTHEKNFPLWMSTNPKAGEWQEAVSPFQVGAWDPAFFLDEDKKLYLDWGSSNTEPLYGQQIDRRTFRPLGRPKKLLALDDKRFGWQRFGEYLDNTALNPFIEGAWMTKHAGKYYLQYGAPGTEFSGYADGVQIGAGPLGPFRPQAHNPFSYKPGGFAHGAGHGNTFQDRWGGWWHASTMVVNVKNSFERRLGLWPAGFDSDGVLYANTTFGDYPHFLPTGLADYQQNLFTGWLLLNCNKPVQASSTLGAYAPNYAVDESIKTYWSAATGDPGEWFQTDLGRVSTVQAIQINYADQDAATLGKPAAAYHQYRLYSSLNGKTWQLLVDKSRNRTDVPHDYVDLPEPVQARYLKLENRHMPTGKFALSGLRVFGRGPGSPPPAVRGLTVLRTPADKRSAWLKWNPVDGAYAYNIYVGSTYDKLYSCIMVHGANEYYFKGMDKNQTYYFTIEAVNENGISPQSLVQETR